MRRSLALVTLLPLALAGCALHPAHNRGIHAVREDRDRVLLLEDVPSRRGSDDAEGASVAFRPMASLNVSFEDVAGNGFILEDVAPAKEGTLFRFQRPIPEKRRITNGPMEFTGVYEVESAEVGAAPIHYVLAPRKKGYRVHVMGGEAAEDRGGVALWDGEFLRWRHGDEENTLELSPDGRSVIHVTTLKVPPGEPVQRSTRVEAFRVQ